MIDIRKLKELVRLMVNNDLTELDLRDSEEQVTLRRHGDFVTPVVTPSITTAPVAVAAAPSSARPAMFVVHVMVGSFSCVAPHSA